MNHGSLIMTDPASARFLNRAVVWWTYPKRILQAGTKTTTLLRELLRVVASILPIAVGGVASPTWEQDPPNT